MSVAGAPTLEALQEAYNREREKAKRSDNRSLI